MKEIEIAVGLGKEPDVNVVREAAAKALGVKPAMVGECRLLRRSIDARKEPLWRCRYEVCKVGELGSEPYAVAPYQDVHNAPEVIVVGSGPAGMFAALHLLQRGLKPVILERGRDVHARKRDIAALSTGALVNADGTPHVNPDSNYCFGEGGAGTFSDGKLSPVLPRGETYARCCISWLPSGPIPLFSPMPIHISDRTVSQL